jgi:hypothetical protein
MYATRTRSSGKVSDKPQQATRDMGLGQADPRREVWLVRVLDADGAVYCTTARRISCVVQMIYAAPSAEGENVQ